MCIVPLQNAFSMVESKASHQVDGQHLQTTHQHTSDIVKSQQIFDEDNHQVNDCHHCGHCSGFHLSWVALEHEHLFLKTQGKLKLHHQFQLNTGYSHPLLRPPIS